MPIFSVPLSIDMPGFIRELPSPLVGIVDESEWGCFIDCINGIVAKKKSLWKHVFTNLDKEVEDYIVKKNIIFEKRGFRVIHPKEMHYQKLEVSLGATSHD